MLWDTATGVLLGRGVDFVESEHASHRPFYFNSVGIGLGVGWLMARLLACPVAFRRHVTCSVAFANVGNLPLVFVAALCHDPRTAFHRTLGARCEHLGISYIAVSIFAATFLQFTIAVRMLRPPVTVSIGGAEGKSELAEESDQGLIAAPVRARVGSTWGAPPLAPPSSGEGERAPLLRFDTQTSMRSSVELSLWSSDGRVDHGAFLAMSGDSFRRATDDEADEVEVLVDSHGEWHRPGPSDGAGMCGERTGTSGPTNGPPADGSPVPPMDQPMPRHRLRRAASWALQGLARLPQSILSSPPPATAAVLGVLVGCIGPVRDLLYPASADPESGVPALFFLSDTIVTVSGAMIPCAIVLLGAVLYRSWREQGGSLPARVVAGTIFCRLVVLPAITTPLILLAVKLHLITVIDPLFFFCLLAAHMSPTAINMQARVVVA